MRSFVWLAFLVLLGLEADSYRQSRSRRWGVDHRRSNVDMTTTTPRSPRSPSTGSGMAASTGSSASTPLSVKPAVATEFVAETDYLGQINFCLRSTDGALTGPSRSKLLNELTNDVFRSILIGDDYGIEVTLASFSTYRKSLAEQPCYLDFSELTANSKRPVTLLESGKGVSGSVDGESVDLSCNVDGGTMDSKTALTYISWLEQLLKTGTTTDEVLGGIYDRGYKGILTLLKGAGCRFEEGGTGTGKGEGGQRPRPAENNICLSLVDLATPLPTKTKELNKISNCVSRAVLYGGRKEKDRLAATIDARASEFAGEWCKGDQRSQEVLYLRALSTLLGKGLAVTEKLVSGVGFEMSSSVFGESDLEGGIGSVEFNREPPLRLFDAYSNAFHRVVEMCLSEISARADMVPQNEDVLLNFVQWEQSLRRNLTSEFWRQNPAELVGTWELIDIAGQGSLQPIMTKDTELYFGLTEGVMVELSNDGQVNMKWPGVKGLQWFFKPGPAHLDTCEFSVRSETTSDLVLTYVGFIDRGQRIESRFSRKPIRMTGRVVSSKDGAVRGSSRFIMALRRVKGGAIDNIM